MITPKHLQDIAGRRFQRGQVEHALWAWFSGEQTGAPAVFRGRIKKLLDIDREPVVLAWAEVSPSARHAFLGDEPRGQGFESEFSPFDVFCLAIGLELLDLGFKQAEIVFLLRHIRGELDRWFTDILRQPPAGRMDQGVDNRCFMTVGKVELVERVARTGTAQVILKPQFARGLEAATQLLGHLGYSDRKLILLEVGNTAVSLCNHLDQAPVPQKGRPRKG